MISVGEQLRCKECGQYTPDRCTCIEWKSCAQWPLDVYKGMYGDGISTDTHINKEAARAVCSALEAEGFGGEGKHFPIKTWIAPAWECQAGIIKHLKEQEEYLRDLETPTDADMKSRFTI